MALFLILPEAVAAGQKGLVVGFCLLGCLTFGLLETILHSLYPSPQRASLGLLPLVTAVAFHSLLDGWNIGFAMQFSGSRLIIAFVLGMSLHKLTSGFALGAIFRVAEPRQNRAITWAGGCELMTAAGAFLQHSISTHMGGQWMILLSSATAGSFLYLGYHSTRIAMTRCGLRPTLALASIGLASIWLISLFHE
jgi:zinc transporter ZupT